MVDLKEVLSEKRTAHAFLLWKKSHQRKGEKNLLKVIFSQQASVPCAHSSSFLLGNGFRLFPQAPYNSENLVENGGPLKFSLGPGEPGKL